MTGQSEQGKLIVFEGYDGVGKSTLAKKLTARICEAGVSCKHLAFPGKKPSSLGRLVDDLHHNNVPGLCVRQINPTSLQVLHIAAHINSIEKHILPSLRKGTWVILDRFWWSTWVYGVAYGSPKRSLEAMIELELLHWGHVKPEVLFLVERKTTRPSEEKSLQGNIIEGYRKVANREKLLSNVVTLHNDSSIEAGIDFAWEAITSIAQELFQGRVSEKGEKRDD